MLLDNLSSYLIVPNLSFAFANIAFNNKGSKRGL